MFRNAVVCTDLSSCSDGIVKCAEQLSVLGVYDAVLVHIIELDHSGAVPGTDGDAVFERQVEELEYAGITVRVDTAVGYAPYEIERIALEHEAGLIVAGSHGRGLLDGVMSGSVSSDLVRIAQRPILLTASFGKNDPERVGASCASMLSNVLFPSDFTSTHEHATRLVIELADKGLRSVTLLHVVQRDASSGAKLFADDAHDKLTAFAAHLRDMGVRDVRTEVFVGDADRIVSKAAASGEYSLIVLGPHCGEDSDAALDSVTNATLQTTVVPVLLAPPRWRP